MCQRKLSIQHFIEVEAVHANDALAPTEGGESIITETAIADKETVRPRRLLLDLADVRP